MDRSNAPVRAQSALVERLKIDFARSVLYGSVCVLPAWFLGVWMRRASKFKVAVVLLLLVLLLGSSAAVSVTVAEILFVIMILVVVGMVVLSIVVSRFGRKRR